MSRYDVTQASDLVLLAAARAALGPSESGALPLSITTRRCLEAFAALLVDDPAEGFYELQALRVQCRRKTRPEYDREIGELLRSRLESGTEKSWAFDPLHTLVEASRSAPEDEP